MYNPSSKLSMSKKTIDWGNVFATVGMVVAGTVTVGTMGAAAVYSSENFEKCLNQMDTAYQSRHFGKQSISDIEGLTVLITHLKDYQNNSSVTFTDKLSMVSSLECCINSICCDIKYTKYLDRYWANNWEKRIGIR